MNPYDEDKLKMARQLRREAQDEGNSEKYDRAGQLYDEIGMEYEAQICYGAADMLRKTEAA